MDLQEALVVVVVVVVVVVELLFFLPGLGLACALQVLWVDLVPLHNVHVGIPRV